MKKKKEKEKMSQQETIKFHCITLIINEHNMLIWKCVFVPTNHCINCSNFINSAKCYFVNLSLYKVVVNKFTTTKHISLISAIVPLQLHW